ncbi:MAG: AAA family ATPase [Deltaproteobacteria bacterium]|nr:MAG: AAA family ATPase [Deltaproteobacteria bacterium]
MDKTAFYPRFLRPRIEEALTDSPVVLIHGPRQCGKTTLARLVGDDAGFAYFTFDDDVQRAAAQADPVGYVADLPEQAVLDEVQRVPELFTSLKTAVDSRRKPGSFILTGSANVLLVPRLADSLAGRMEILRLHPLAQAEIEGKAADFLGRLFAADFKAGKTGRRLGKALAQRVAGGGFPAALVRATPRRRSAWYRDYADTLVQRDIRDLARISALDALPRLLAMAAGQSACLVNVSELAGPFQISRQTIREYLTLLSRIFLVDELPPWHSNRMKRLVKTPKLHLGDTGLACALLGLDEDSMWADRALFGRILETFVYQELRRHAGWQESVVWFSHFRDKDQVEVDMVLESEGFVAGVEVKAASTVTIADFKGLRKLQAATAKAFAAGVVLYDGDAVVGFGDRLYAVPISRLWEGE